MSNKRRNNTPAILGIALLLVIIMVVGIVGSVAKNTEDFTIDVTPFKVSCNGNTVNNMTVFEMSFCNDYTFNVSYALDFLPSQNRGYSVKVVPHTSLTYFKYYVDGIMYSFKDCPSFNDVFIKNVDENSFVLNIPKDLPSLLRDKYPNSVVENVPSMGNTNTVYFDLVITSNKGEVITLPLKLLDVPVEEIQLDITEIHF